MSRVEAFEFQRVFRFAFELKRDGDVIDSDVTNKFSRLGVSEIRWEGRDLVMTRGMQLQPPRAPLHETVREMSLELVMFDAEGNETKRFALTHKGCRSRGFDFMNAMENDVAREAVLFVDAEFREIKK